ncbi:MAG TPA: hypothetical protein VFJ77_05800 [Gaiellaceae bacterium]|nr:hypothetical protein [Gaiellaceae bacterium]
MKRAILGTGAVLAAAAAVAGCGGGGSASGTTVGVTTGGAGGVAGVQTTKGGMSFSAQVNGMQKQLAAALKQFRRGNVAGAASIGGSLLTNCRTTVDRKLAPRANTTAKRQAVSHLRLACQDMANASQQATSGNMEQAKQLARQALAEVTTAKAALKGNG